MKKKILLFLLVLTIATSAAFAGTNSTNHDVTGKWDAVNNNQVVSVQQIGSRIYALIEGNGVRATVVGTIVNDVINLEIITNIPGSVNRDYMNEGRGVISKNGSEITWSGGFLNNIKWKKTTEW